MLSERCVYGSLKMDPKLALTISGFRQRRVGGEDDDFASDEADMSDDDNVSDVGSLGEQSFMSAETKTRFTNYSMSSSVIRRNEGLTLLDDRFEHVGTRIAAQLSDVSELLTCYSVK